MTTPQQTLFATLPAELRNEIYSYLCTSSSSSSQHPSTTALPLTTKTYNLPHTTLTLTPTHTGSTSLLALSKHNVLEAAEYHAYLLTHGISVLVAIDFHGHVSTFDARHWADRTSASLRKLVKKYRWLANARVWDVRIVWNPPAFAAQHGPWGRSGEIARALVETVGGFVRGVSVGKRSVDFRARWCLPRYVASLNVVIQGYLGIEGFLRPVGDGGGVQEREVVVLGLEEQDGRFSLERMKPGLLRASLGSRVEGELLSVVNERALWRDDVAGGTLLMRTVVEGGKVAWEEPDCKEEDGQTPLGLSVLRNEYLQGRDAWLARS
ncbi:hypothetical protein K491DRAFT_691786 [Lophiostoma macrostomum CBS 122681]|uniref:Uncharacterized protein n=1 Tax=Lophiostoma macrostomum CBS 122681 TaxID=1314788 RepID=A0A6A6TAD7_9PLEO|nr:hypothetical protein K491DRAFT_691786 [Lophiostoma macrostomum CBS 122681]